MNEDKKKIIKEIRSWLDEEHKKKLQMALRARLSRKDIPPEYDMVRRMAKIFGIDRPHIVYQLIIDEEPREIYYEGGLKKNEVLDSVKNACQLYPNRKLTIEQVFEYRKKGAVVEEQVMGKLETRCWNE